MSNDATRATAIILRDHLLAAEVACLAADESHENEAYDEAAASYWAYMAEKPQNAQDMIERLLLGTMALEGCEATAARQLISEALAFVSDGVAEYVRNRMGDD